LNSVRLRDGFQRAKRVPACIAQGGDWHVFCGLALGSICNMRTHICKDLHQTTPKVCQAIEIYCREQLVAATSVSSVCIVESFREQPERLPPYGEIEMGERTSRGLRIVEEQVEICKP
jgi:hypothetical protein